MKLKILDLGNVSGIDFFSYADYPLLNYNNNFWFVYGTISDNHFSIGYNRDVSDYIDESELKDYTFSRYIERGGLMWCGNEIIIRIVYPKNFIETRELLLILVKVLKYDYNLNINYKNNYIYLNGNKISGFSSTSTDTATTFTTIININSISERIKSLYKNKKFDGISYVDMPMEEFTKKLIFWIKDKYNLEQEYMDKNGLDISGIKQINLSDDWLYKKIRKDILWEQK